MLLSANRLRSSNAVRRPLRYGKTVKRKLFTVKYIDSNNPKHRIAVVISKKVSKKAVVRNKIKRKITEAIRQNIASKIVKGFDIAIIVHSKDLLNLSSLELVVELNSSFMQAGLVDDK